MDSKHKLISWRVVIHGCIDGASRCIMYLKCSSDNLAQTVRGYFQEGVRAFVMPSRVLADKEVENINVARFFINMKGVGRRSFITGKSVHNQHIDQLWAETNRVLSIYYKDSLSLWKTQLLCSLDEIDLYIPHFVFHPRIQRSLDKFHNQWNYHGLSSMGHKAPVALWMQGDLLHSSNLGHDAVDVESFGVDYNGPSGKIDTANNVQVPFVNIFLPPDALNHRQALCDICLMMVIMA